MHLFHYVFVYLEIEKWVTFYKVLRTAVVCSLSQRGRKRVYTATTPLFFRGGKSEIVKGAAHDDVFNFHTNRCVGGLLYRLIRKLMPNVEGLHWKVYIPTPPWLLKNRVWIETKERCLFMTRRLFQLMPQQRLLRRFFEIYGIPPAIQSLL